MKIILIVENNVDFAYAIQWHFEQIGYSVICTATGKEAIAFFDAYHPDVVLLDINLDDTISGKEVARHIRMCNKEIPIIFMSGESKSPNDVVESFEIGANYFLKKPLALPEIDIHVKVAINATKTGENQFVVGDYVHSHNERIIKFREVKEYLSDKENSVLKLLSEHISKTVILGDILQRIWNNTSMEESLRNVISSLRKKLHGKGLKIETVKNKGYRLDYDTLDIYESKTE